MRTESITRLGGVCPILSVNTATLREPSGLVYNFAPACVGCTTGWLHTWPRKIWQNIDFEKHFVGLLVTKTAERMSVFGLYEQRDLLEL